MSRMPLVLLLAQIVPSSANEYRHTGGGLTSVVMASIISMLPPVTPPKAGVRPGSLMHTVRLCGAYQADVPLVLPSYTRLILNGTMDALPYKLGWTAASAGAANQTASMVSVKGAQMVSVEGGSWSCAKWNASEAEGNCTTVTAIFFELTSFSFIRNLKVTGCGSWAGGNVSVGSDPRPTYSSGNIRIHGGQSNVVQNVESAHSDNRGLWAQTNKLVVTGGSFHHNNADGIDLDSSSSHNTIHNVTAYMNGRMGIFMEFNSGYNTIVDCNMAGNHFAGISPGSQDMGGWTPPPQYTVLIGNVLGPSTYPAGCPQSQRPCPSFCPTVPPSCRYFHSKGLPCGTCHYTDAASGPSGFTRGMAVEGSIGTIAVLNDLGGSFGGAGSGRTFEALVALNYNGAIDNTGVLFDAPNKTSSVFSFNPDAKLCHTFHRC